MAFIYNVNDTATQVLAAKQIKENMFVELLHRNGKGVTETVETNASTVRMLKYKPLSGDARTLGASKNGAFFNGAEAEVGQVSEYDLNLLHLYDRNLDIPEVQQDMCPANLFDAGTKNIAGRVSTEINASTLAYQIKAYADAKSLDNAVVLDAEPNYYSAFLDASTRLDDGDADNGIQTFPVEEREFICRPSFRRNLMTGNGVIVGGSNFAQSMLAKGGVDPDAKKDGSMYVGEIDLIPVYIAPKPIWDRAKTWAGSSAVVDTIQGIMMAASATDRGISTQDYVKIIDSPSGAGKRLQPKVRWGVNVCYAKGIVPIVANGTTEPTVITITAPGSV